MAHGAFRDLLPTISANVRRVSTQLLMFIALAIAAGIGFTTILFSVANTESTVLTTGPCLDLSLAPFWKDDRAVSREMIADRLAYWNHQKPCDDVDFELVMVNEEDTDKYLTFEPDRGGFNNVRMQLEILVQIARVTHRILVLPPSTNWNHLPGLSNLGDYYELTRTARYIRIIDIDQYLQIVGSPIRSATHSADDIYNFLRNQPDSFVPKWHPDQEALVFERGAVNRVPSAAAFLDGRQPIHYDDTIHSYRNLHFRSDYENGYRLLATPCTFIYYPTLQWERHAFAILRDGFHFRHDIFAAAAVVIEQILRRSGKYNAVHVRRNDFRLQYADKVVAWAELGKNLEKTLDPDLPVYIATDEDVRNDPDFSHFSHIFNTVYVLGDFQLPNQINPNWHGMIEQIICSSAEKFIGTELSTFTAYIQRLRGYMTADVAPDKQIYYTTDRFTGYAYVDGWRTYRTWMSLSDKDVADGSGGFWQREYWISWQLS